MRFPKPVVKALFSLTAMLSLAVFLSCRGSDNPPPPPVAPAISTQPANQTVLEGATATFTVTATGTAPLSYQWMKGGTAITGATSASYTTPATVMADSGSSFTVTVSNAAGPVTSSAATLTVNPAPPTITTQPSNITVTAGATAAFSVVATGTAPLSYQWKKGDTAISGATSATYTTPATTLADNGASFTVTVTNTASSVTSGAAILTVQAAPVFTTQPTGGTVTAGASVTFTAAATGNPAPAYQWYKGATLLTGQTAATLSIASATLADAGSYTVTATNTLGSVTSGAAVLVVNQAPIFSTQPASLTVVAPAPASFTAAASGFPTPTYQWRKDGVDIGGATNATYTLNPTSLADAATYTCVATNSLGSSTSNGAVLTIQVPPAITTQPTGATVTAGTPASFTVVATGTPAPTYQWQKSGVNIGGATSATYTIASTTLADAGAYTVVVTNPAGILTSDAAVLTVNAPPVITAQPANQSVVEGQTATFSVTATGNPAPTYQWRKGGLAIGGATASTYTTPVTVLATDDGSIFDVVVTNSLGTVTSAVATLTVNPTPVAPAISTQPASQTVASGASVTFSVVATGTPTPTYQWYKNGAAIPGATNSSYTIAAVAPTDAGVYAVSATNSVSTVTSSGATLSVLFAPVITVQPASQTVSQGSNVTFSVAANGNPAPTYQWRFNGVDIPSATASTYTINSVGLVHAGSYDVVLTNSQGSVTSTAATLTVTPNYSVSGRVTLANGGSGVAGVTVSINTTPTATTTVTDGSGNFTLPNIPNGTYTLTPSLSGASALFFPATQSVTVVGADLTNVQFQAAIGYTVSGTVSYAGAKTGRVYLRLDGGQGGGTPGVSIASAGTFTIRGVAPGTYTLSAWMDTVGLGIANASNPSGATSGISVSSANVTGLSLVLADAAAINLTGTAGPAIGGAAPFNGGAMVFYEPLTDGSGIETADSYLLEASTSSSFATIAKTLTFQAQGDEPCFISGLTDGQAYYFRLKAKAGATTSDPGTATAAITIGAGTGANTVSGTVTFPGTATGPLAVGLFNDSTGQGYLISIPNPVSPQAFSLSGVPAGTYFFFGIIDQNNNGIIDPGDISNTNSNSNTPGLTVSGNLTGQALALSNAGALASVSTTHQKSTNPGGTWETYGLQFSVDGNAKLPVNVTLNIGTSLLDIGKPMGDSGYWYWMNLGPLRPGSSDSYLVQVGYSDGSSEDLTVTVSAVLDTFPLNLAPVTGAAAGTTPTFSWTAPSPAPSFPYTYSLWIGPTSGGGIWQYPRDGEMPSSQTSVLYNVDGNASQPTLTSGVTYMWSVMVRDANGNQAQQAVEYRP